uniref:6-cysteine protein n=1 Tax=Meloidogyne hapla TaxID=6305 RepID=A0A1I8BAQ7_MELHA
MKLLLEVCLLLLLYAKPLLPFSSDAVKPDLENLENKFECFSSEKLNNELISKEGIYSDKKNEFYAIAPQNMNKNITFTIKIYNYNDSLGGEVVAAKIKKVGAKTYDDGKAKSCKNETKKIFFSECVNSEKENISCIVNQEGAATSCNTMFTMNCKIDNKQIKGKQYDLLTFKIQRKEKPKICNGNVEFSTNATGFYFLIDKNNTKNNSLKLDQCVQKMEFNSSTTIVSLTNISLTTEKNETITSILSTKRTTFISSSISTIPSIVIVSTNSTKKELSFTDCLTDIILIILLVIFILSLPIMLFLIFYKPKPDKIIEKEGEKTVVVEEIIDGDKSNKEKEPSKFMAVKTIAMQSDQVDSEDLGQTGLTNIADNSDISDRPEKVQHNEDKDKEDEEMEEMNKEQNEEQRRSRDGVEVPETILDTTMGQGIAGGVEEVPLYEEM